MRIFCISDIHIDFKINRQWLSQLSEYDYKLDILILAGDLSDQEKLLSWAFRILADRFKHVIFVPGNHDLWINNTTWHNSFDKFTDILSMAEAMGVHTKILELEQVCFVPLQSWYDFSFAEDKDNYLSQRWMDFKRCQWGQKFAYEGNKKLQAESVCDYFLSLNPTELNRINKPIISISHFLPRIDLMPSYIPLEHQKIYPVLGTKKLDAQIRKLKSHCHIYGHSHVNRDIEIDKVRYINNAFGYPNENRISRKALLEIPLEK